MLKTIKSRNRNSEWYNPYLAAALALAFIAVGSWYGYGWYRNRVESAAQKDLSEIVDELRKKGDVADEHALTDLAHAFATGAQRHKGSHLYPYFLAYQADMLLQLKKNTEAQDVLSTMMAAIDKKSPLYDAYAIKAALVFADAQDAAMRERGMNQLKEIAASNANPFKPMALHYLDMFASQANASQANAA